MSTFSIPAVIFAGGKSSRMGKDKALLPFGGASSLSAFQYQRLGRWFPKVYIATKERKFDFDAPLIFDAYEGASPLVALVSAFEALPQEEMLFVLSVDAPFITKEIIASLIEKMQKNPRYDVVAAATQEGVEPLCAIYRRTILPHAKEALAKDRHRMTALLASVSSETVAFENEKLFLNLNRPHEYKAALAYVTSSKREECHLPTSGS